MPLHSGARAFRGLDPARCGGRMGRTAGGRVGMALGTLAAAGVACVAYGVLIERHWYRLRHETVPALKPGQPPCTVLHLSDFHLLAAALKSLSRFHPRFGSVAVLGSNDSYAPQPKNYLSYFRRRRRRRLPRGRNPWQELVEGLEGMGWLVLGNRRGRLGDLELAGMSDPHIRLDDLTVPVPADGHASRLRIGVVHSPYQRSLNAFERSGYQLVLAGHTHGGQVRLPGVGALVTNCDLPREQVRGLSRWGSTWLHVSAGLGTSKYAPFRFACRPEATLLTLVPA